MPTARASMASRADPHRLYERSVQDVVAEIDFVDATYLALRGRRASRLREDFCGTANTSCEWVKRRSSNTAVGIDLDEKTLDWGVQNNIRAMTAAQRNRIRVLRRDVRFPGPAGHHADIVLAMNFSYWLLAQREDLVRYFRAVRRSLRGGGVFFLDHWAGWESMKPHREVRHYRNFKYVWQMASYNPINAMATCHIHFSFPDGSRLSRAFTYVWRVWTLPELRDALLDAGFARVTVYWEGDDGKGGGNGIFMPETQGEACASAISFVAAEK